MKTIGLIFPHQLFDVTTHPVLETLPDELHLLEDSLFFGDHHVQIPFHVSKLVLHRASMQAYLDQLQSSYPDLTIVYHEYLPNQTVEDTLRTIGTEHTFLAIDPTDYLLERRLRRTLPHLTLLESPLFLNTREENKTWAEGKKKFLMHHFYTAQRKRLNILLDTDGGPAGGQWSFDHDNRKKIPKKLIDDTPPDPAPSTNQYVADARTWVAQHFPDNPGASDLFWYPVTHDEALAWFEDFLVVRFENFGTYEDAMLDTHHVLYHSVLSPLMNIGLLDVRTVVERSLAYAREHDTPLHSVEGFIRQIIGWREYVRMMYEHHGTNMRKQNHWKHQRPLPAAFWDGSTGLDPVDNAVKKINETGYLHHIERLMVIGNSMFLLGIAPDEVYHWFMSLSIDSYDWVMVPNIYGMSQHAAGSFMTTKPYVSGSNYIKKMSHVKKGPWCDIWDALYWHFIITHQQVLSENYRMHMITRRVDSFSDEKKKDYESIVTSFRESLERI